MQGVIEKKNFEIKKETEKCNELSKQIEFAKREQVRNQVYLEN
jgi:hypothetical protein